MCRSRREEYTEAIITDYAEFIRLCGWKVDSMVVGFGRTLSQFRVNNTKVEIRAIPIEGFVMALIRRCGLFALLGVLLLLLS